MIVTACWRRTDGEGHEWAQLAPAGAALRLSGVAVFASDGRPGRLDYVVLLDARGLTTSAAVSGHVNGAPLRQTLTVTGDRRWAIDGRERPDLAGCEDVDFAFSVATNLLPLRRLTSSGGGSLPARAAWLGPDFAWQPLAQTYTRIDEQRVRYEVGEAALLLDADAEGVVAAYPERFVLVARDVA